MLSLFRPPFEVVIEGWNLYFVSEDKRFEFDSTAFNEKSSLEDKRFKISNLDLIRNMADIVNLEEVSIDFKLP